MNIYEKNLEFFRQNIHSIYECLMLEKSRYDSKINIINDSLNLCVENEGKKCFVHSTYNTESENCSMFSSIDKDVEKIVIFGFGVGKCINYICDKFENLRNITIIEPDLNIFKVMLNYVDVSELSNKIGTITFIINKTKEEATKILWNCLKENLTQKVELTYNISYRSLYPEYFVHINNRITSNIKNFVINMATNDFFLFNWAENIIKNNKHCAPFLGNLSGEFKDIPVILVSAGPSLNYNIQYLKQVKNKAVIIALGSAIKILDSNGIIPHFRLAFDGSDNERNIFKNIDTEASVLIFSDMLNYNILNEYKGNKLRMVLNTDYISQYIQSKIHDDNYIFECGFSVANVALDVVIKLGFSKVIFIGQDLCYTDGNIHAKGTWIQENEYVDFNGIEYIKTINVIGETVYTDNKFLGMRDMLEHKIKSNSGITFVNATEKGLNIEGTVNKTFLQAMKDAVTNEFNIDHVLNKVFGEENEDNNIEKLEVVNSTLINELKDSIKINDYRLKKLKKLNKYYEKGLGIGKLNIELKYIKTIESELENSSFYKKAVKPMIFNKIKTIFMNYAYNGKDEKILLEKNIRALLGQTIVVKEYLSFILNLLQE
ncbi:motility associated factor glycosyltransferase family protein [Clostridium vincentii]|uniref:6-hydroxymethylpterin diphosphokinase MptE-like domain-containing protein n=1 Tax=Clostridium vincentii TaxID=52704 RepID=A0A2T0BG64_9CLOT|nr:6-hydroxymethylpterin diphosphokinase MptE-like protein [Clostridium vincentii]PRR82844.1 hypothetical protein CLVI_14810 [Clostridium vincentii]